MSSSVKNSGDYKYGIRKFLAPEFLFGTGVINYIGRYVGSFGGEKILLVSDEGVVAAGWCGVVEKQLRDKGISYVRYTDVTPNPRDSEVMKGVELYKKEECDMIVAVGGGSPMDLAKGVGASWSNEVEVNELEGVDKVVVPSPPLICIPTTAGTAAEVSQFAIINSVKQKNKMAIISKGVVPDLALIDPQTTVTMPPYLTATTGMDALSHAIEAFMSNASSPVTDINALRAIELIRDNLKTAYNEPENREARENMLLGSLLAGLAFSNASLGLVHSMAHSLGGMLDLPHGFCNAVLLEHIVEFNYSSVEMKNRELGSRLGLDISETELKAGITDHIIRLRESVGIGNKLIDEYDIESSRNDLVRNAMNDPCLVTNPAEVREADISAILDKVF